MLRHHFLIAIFGIATINGILSPFLLFAVLFVIPIAPMLLWSDAILRLFAMLLVSTFTVMLAGVPAALYERVRGHEESTEVSLWLWLAGVCVLSLPAMINLVSLAF